MPDKSLGDPKELLLGYLDKYREVIAHKLDGLSDEQLRTSVLPSGWVPLGLLRHLVYMERRWLRWGFMAEPISDPWGDSGGDASAPGWVLAPRDSLRGLVEALHDGGARTREIVALADLSTRSAIGGRFGPDDPIPTLGWILCHVFEEYARHAGHLDIARELVDGTLGE